MNWEIGRVTYAYRNNGKTLLISWEFGLFNVLVWPKCLFLVAISYL